MDDYLISSVIGKRVLNIAKYSELLDQFTSELDYSKIFKADVTYDAKVLEQQGKQAKLNINGWILTAESLLDEKLSSQIQLKFVATDKNTLSFKLVKNGAAPAAGSYAVDIKMPDCAEHIREFMPGASNEQIKAFIRTLPQLEGDLFRSMVSFNYLYKLDEAKVGEKTTLLSGNLTIDLEAFQNELKELARLVPGVAARASLPELKELLSRIGTVLEKMDKKADTAGRLQILVDHESVEFKDTLSALAAKLSSLSVDEGAAGNSATQERPLQEGGVITKGLLQEGRAVEKHTIQDRGEIGKSPLQGDTAVSKSAMPGDAGKSPLQGDVVSKPAMPGDAGKSPLQGDVVSKPAMPGAAGKSPLQGDTAVSKPTMPGEALFPGSSDLRKALPAGGGIRQKSDGPENNLPLKIEGLPVHGKNTGEISGVVRSVESRQIGELKELVSQRLNPEKLVESAFKQTENTWQTTFALNTALPSSFLKDFRIEERAHRPEKDESREYQITLEFNFKKVGQVKTILFWMDNVLSCRMICRDPAAYVLLQSSREQLRERLKNSDIPVNSLKIESAEV